MTASKGIGKGGKREGAGRPQGAIGRSTAEHKATLSELARQHTTLALETLVSIARSGESDASRVAAANSLLDRAYGKAPQALEHTGADGGAILVRTLADFYGDSSDGPA